MGQYQQWLFAQEIDRRLKAEIDTLETELFYLQDRITILEQVVPATENVILQALTEHLQGQAIQEQQAEVEKDTQSQEATGLQAHPTWSELPRPETPPTLTTPDEATTPYLSRTYSQREMSEDMLAFFDKRSQTDPKLSALLQRERQRVHATGKDDHQVDDETRRLNENIQRWFIRWHRQVASDGQTEGVENEQ